MLFSCSLLVACASTTLNSAYVWQISPAWGEEEASLYKDTSGMHKRKQRGQDRCHNDKKTLAKTPKVPPGTHLA